jgi:hypothetical protein
MNFFALIMVVFALAPYPIYVFGKYGSIGERYIGSLMHLFVTWGIAYIAYQVFIALTFQLIGVIAIDLVFLYSTYLALIFNNFYKPKKPTLVDKLEGFLNNNKSK